MNNLKISTRLIAGFALFLVLIGLMAGVGIWRVQANNAADQHVQRLLTNERLISKWGKLIEVNSARTMAAGLAESPSTQKLFQDAMSKASEEVVRLQQELRASLMDTQAVALYDAVLTQRGIYRDARQTALDARTAGNIQAATRFFEHDLETLSTAYLGSVEALLDYQQHLMDETRASLHADNESGRLMLIIFAAVALLIGIVLTLTIPRSITRPLQRAVQLAETVASRDLTSNIDSAGSDETARLLQSLKLMNQSLVGVVGDVRSGAHAIAIASDQILAGNRDLSSRTDEQASSLTETAAAMEELTATVQQNAHNAQQANLLAVSASDVATRGGEIVAQVVTTMETIHGSSQKVNDIIGVIDSIAFQTNILALNAAVEAARAGEEGKGFAVVASEVRALAQRSAAAAREIKELIVASTSATETGNRLVSDAGATMSEIVASIKRVTDIMGEITAASSEQSSGIQQVNQAVIEMDHTTQQNAALVEEAAAAANSLQDQARHLAGIVATFRLNDQGVGRSDMLVNVVANNRPALGSSPGKGTAMSSLGGPASRKPVTRPVLGVNSQQPRVQPAGIAPAVDEWEEF